MGTIHAPTPPVDKAPLVGLPGVLLSAREVPPSHGDHRAAIDAAGLLACTVRDVTYLGIYSGTQVSPSSFAPPEWATVLAENIKELAAQAQGMDESRMKLAAQVIRFSHRCRVGLDRSLEGSTAEPMKLSLQQKRIGFVLDYLEEWADTELGDIFLSHSHLADEFAQHPRRAKLAHAIGKRLHNNAVGLTLPDKHPSEWTHFKHCGEGVARVFTRHAARNGVDAIGDARVHLGDTFAQAPVVLGTI